MDFPFRKFFIDVPFPKKTINSPRPKASPEDWNSQGYQSWLNNKIPLKKWSAGNLLGGEVGKVSLYRLKMTSVD